MQFLTRISFQQVLGNICKTGILPLNIIFKKIFVCSSLIWLHINILAMLPHLIVRHGHMTCLVNTKWENPKCTIVEPFNVYDWTSHFVPCHKNRSYWVLTAASVLVLEWVCTWSRDTADPQSMMNTNNVFEHECW